MPDNGRKAVARVQGERSSRKEKESGPLSIKSLKKIITIMNQAKITELDLEQDGVKIHLRKGPTREELVSSLAQPVSPAAAPMPVAPLVPAAAVTPALSANLHTITSPMVGTFYRAPSPEANTYVETGSRVEENTIVCIVEAMKLMNDIKAEVKGVIKEILVENAQAVEFGQPLFLVERKG